MTVERYQFIPQGHDAVVAAFRSVGSAAAQSKSQVEKAFEGMPRAAARSAGRVVDAEERAQAKRIALLERASSARKARIDKAADAEVRALEKKLAREQAAEEKAAAKRTQLAEKTAAKELALAQKTAEKAAKDAQRAAEKAGRARRGAWQRAIAPGWASMSQEDRGAVPSAIRGVGSMFGLVGTGIALVGGAAIAATALATNESLKLDDASRRLAIQGSTGTHREDPTALRHHFEQTAIDVRGARAADVAAGASRFVGKTGDLQAAKEFSRTMAEVSVASGAAAEDIGDAMADIFQKFDVKTAKEMSDAMAMLYVQGKRGAFELKDAASQFPRLAAAAQRFGLGKGAKSLATLGGLTQIARSATGSPEEAATALEGVFRDLTSKDAKLNALGVKTYEGTGKDKHVRDIREILIDTVAKVGGNDPQQKAIQLGKIFDARGMRAMAPLISTFNDAVKQGKDGVRALRDKLNEAIDATGAETELKQDLATAQESASAQLTAAWEAVKVAVGENLTPTVAQLAKELAFVVQRSGPQLASAFNTAAHAALDFARFIGLVDREASPEEQAAEKGVQDLTELKKEQKALLERGMTPETKGQGLATAEERYAMEAKIREAEDYISTNLRAANPTDEASFVAKRMEEDKGFFNRLVSPGESAFRLGGDQAAIDEAKKAYRENRGSIAENTEAKIKSTLASTDLKPSADAHIKAAAELRGAARELRDAAKQARPHFATDAR